MNSTFSKWNQKLNTQWFIESLGTTFWILVLLASAISLIILFSSLFKLSNGVLYISVSGEGFNYLYDMYKTPIGLLAGAIVILTLRITLQKILQTEKQFEITYEPDVFLDTQRGLIQTPLKFHGSLETNFEIENNSGRYLNIYNVGSVARNVKFQFYWDESHLDIFIEKMKELKIDNKPLQVFVNYFKGLKLYSLENDRIVKVNFIAPSEGKTNEYNLKLSFDYLNLYCLFFFGQENIPLNEDTQQTTIDFVENFEFPVLKLKIDYQNKFLAEDKIFSKYYKIRFFHVTNVKDFIDNVANYFQFYYEIEYDEKYQEIN